MLKFIINTLVLHSIFLCSFSYAGIVIESTRYLYKEGTREISAQVENKDEMPYLIKSWVESAEGQAPSFLATPPLFRLEAKQKNTLRLFATPNIKVPLDRESIFFFNIMAVPPTDDSYANSNTIQLAVRHRMRLIYRPKALSSMSNNEEAKKIEWRKVTGKIIVKNPTPFFYYFNTVQLGNKNITQDVGSIAPFASKEITLKKEQNDPTKITWRIVNDYGGAGTFYSMSL